jgi:hypothetical protein
MWGKALLNMSGSTRKSDEDIRHGYVVTADEDELRFWAATGTWVGTPYKAVFCRTANSARLIAELLATPSFVLTFQEALNKYLNKDDDS